MELTPELLNRLKEYSQSDFYPFHMPGHKRQIQEKFLGEFPNPYSIDITEIEGFDNLHHPEGILKESMDWAAKLYDSDRTYYLVNGSTSGILSAICGTTENGGKILMSRNCHKSAYHGVFLNNLKIKYVYPQILDEFGLQGGLMAEKIQDMLKEDPDIQAVFVVSPTYDGIVSDIKRIGEIVHRYRIPLIVDEAHGAHFSFGRESGFPVSALELGADVVIQSLHKTLPAFTQTAVMHVKKGYVDLDKIDRYIHIYQTSSPSYLLMAGIDNCLSWMSGEGKKRMKNFSENLSQMRENLQKMKVLKLLKEEEKGKAGIFDLDKSKIIVSSAGSCMDGISLGSLLREKYYLEMEMCGPDYVTAITTVADSPEGLSRLEKALMEIDEGLCREERESGLEMRNDIQKINSFKAPVICMTLSDAFNADKEQVGLSDSVGKISTEFIYLYPPGIPLVVPGERMTEEMVLLVEDYKKRGFPVQGLKDQFCKSIFVVK